MNRTFSPQNTPASRCQNLVCIILLYCLSRVWQVYDSCRSLVVHFDAHQNERYERFKRSRLNKANMKKVLACEIMYVAVHRAPVTVLCAVGTLLLPSYSRDLYTSTCMHTHSVHMVRQTPRMHAIPLFSVWGYRQGPLLLCEAVLAGWLFALWCVFWIFCCCILPVSPPPRLAHHLLAPQRPR